MTAIKLVNVDEINLMARTPLSSADIPAEHIQWFHRSKLDFNKDLQLRGKYCYHPFNTVTIDSKGDCFVCVCQAWLPISVGNILDFNSLTDIVRSPKAREIQASIIDGTYKYCDHNTCHLITRNGLEGRISHRPDTVNWIVFAIDESCNLTCPSCRTEMMFHNKGPEFDKRMAISNHITKLIQEHHHFLKFTLSGDGDPFASHVYRNILENLQLGKDSPVEIEIVTNGILVKSHWDRMAGVHDNVMRFKISFDAGSPETYAVTRRGGDWNKLIESCQHIIKWKQKNYSNMEIVANFVVQNSNYRDIHKYVRLAQELGFDEISFQKVVDWGKWTNNGVNYFIEHAVWMDTHPNYPELVHILNHPVMNDRKIQLTNLTELRNKSHRPATLSELVNLKDSVKRNITTVNLESTVDSLVDSLNIVAADLNTIKHVNQLQDVITKIKQNISEANESIIKITDTIDENINILTKDYHKRGYKINGFFASNRTDVSGEQTRVISLEPQTIETIKAQITKYINWYYPGLEIGPGEGIWTECLVAAEPLYIVDIHPEFLAATKSKFNIEYQRRLCDYVTKETDLSMLPQNQMGFVFSWNVFNYLTLDLIDRYLSAIFNVLRPGGVCMFSYNDAERVQAAVLVEKGFMSYAPKTLVVELIKKHGFEVLATPELEQSVSWVEIKKPGELKTIKLHPTIGSVIEK